MPINCKTHRIKDYELGEINGYLRAVDNVYSRGDIDLRTAIAVVTDELDRGLLPSEALRNLEQLVENSRNDDVSMADKQNACLIADLPEDKRLCALLLTAIFNKLGLCGRGGENIGHDHSRFVRPLGYRTDKYEMPHSDGSSLQSFFVSKKIVHFGIADVRDVTSKLSDEAFETLSNDDFFRGGAPFVSRESVNVPGTLSADDINRRISEDFVKDPRLLSAVDELNKLMSGYIDQDPDKEGGNVITLRPRTILFFSGGAKSQLIHFTHSPNPEERRVVSNFFRGVDKPIKVDIETAKEMIEKEESKLAVVGKSR